MTSYWEKKHWLEDCDVAIIGSGLVGLYIANFIKDHHKYWTVSIFDKAYPPLGASTRNAGFACFGTVGETLSDLKKSSEEEVVSMIKMRWQGLKRMLEYSDEKKINYWQKGGLELFRDEKKFASVENSLDGVNELFESATGGETVFQIQNQNHFPGIYSNAIANRLEGQLNPVLLVKDLMLKAREKGVRFHLGCKLDRFEKVGQSWNLQFENKFESKAKLVIVATNAFTNDLVKGLDIIPYRNQVLVSTPMSNLGAVGCFHLDEGYIYFRNIENRILIGGGRHFDFDSEQTSEFEANENIISRLEALATNQLGFKDFEVDHSWSGIIATGNSKKPIIEASDNGIILAVRSGGMGVAISSEIATDVLSLI